MSTRLWFILSCFLWVLVFVVSTAIQNSFVFNDRLYDCQVEKTRFIAETSARGNTIDILNEKLESCNNVIKEFILKNEDGK